MVKLKTGVTGGIGSGKTTVCRIFNVLGIPVFLADSVARILMDSDEFIKRQVNEMAGKEMYPEGVLDRAEMARLIFHNKDLLQKVNDIIHPAVTERFMEWQKAQDSDYVILEAAILFESGASKLLDRIITVVAPVEERIDRVVKRNNLTREQVLERIMNQSDDEYKISLSDYVINNSDNEMIIPAVLKIHSELISEAKNR